MTPPAPIPMEPTETVEATAISAIDLLNANALVFVAAFIVTLLSTPIVRRIAIRADVIDHPDADRKQHPYPVAYLGGIAVFLGLLAAIIVSYLSESPTGGRVPLAVCVGMFAITFTGFADDVWGWDPRLKIAGQLVAAAALAIEQVGVRVVEGMLSPLLGPPNEALLMVGNEMILSNSNLYYWSGTALIAVFVLGGCNATNLIDGLDGLLSGVVAIFAVGLLVICLLIAPTGADGPALVGPNLSDGRIILCLALLGTVLGFLPHNFNPAAIFLGDCGSLLLGYMCVVIILMLGDRGQTHLVFAGLIVFAVPIMDTTLAIIRRVLAGVSLSSGDDQHIHHQLKRSLGGVKRAVLALYGIAILFAIVGVTLVALVQIGLRVRFVYAMALVFFGFIGVIAVKAARRQQLRLKATAPRS